MNKLLAAFLILASIVVIGCVETRSEYTINPDGSGKVIQEITFSADMLNMVQMQVQAQGQAGAEAAEALPLLDAQADPDTSLKLSVKKIIDGSAGVDTWKDISFKNLPDGRMYFKGTAYFKDLNALRFYSGGMNEDTSIEFTQNGNQVKVRLYTTGKPDPDAPPATAVQLSPGEIDQKIQQTKMQFATAKPMMQMMFSGLKTETVFNMPGPIDDSLNVELLSQNSAGIILDGQQIIAAADALMQDDAYLRAQILSGVDPLEGGPSDEGTLNEKLLGNRGPVFAIAVAEGPLFDYNTEVAEARTNYDAMIAQLGLDNIEVPAEQPMFEFTDDTGSGSITITSPTTTTTEGFVPFEDTTVLDPTSVVVQPGGNVRVGGVRLIRYADFAQGILPLGRTEGYTLSLVAQLPSKAVKVTGGVVARAATNNGQDLLPKYAWDRKVRSPLLAPDGQTVVFDVELALPDDAATALEQVSGTLEYLTAAGTSDVDLGTMQLQKDAKGSALGAVISSITKDPFEHNPVGLNLDVNVKAEQIASVRFVAPDGSPLDIRMLAAQSLADVTTLKCASADPLPAKAQVIVTVYEQLTPNQFPWDLTRISLSGGPAR